MRYYPIFPIGMQQTVDELPCEHQNAFVLAHLWDHKRYREMFTRRDWQYCIVDNGVYEGANVHWRTLDEIGRVMAQHAERVFVVGPEVFHDASRTAKVFREYIRERGYGSRPYEDMVVLQAKIISELCGLVDSLANICDAFGLPIWMYRRSWCRAGILVWLRKELGSEVVHHYWHALGLDNLLELYELKQAGYDSVDTSMPYTAAVNRIRLQLNPLIKKSRRVQRVNLLGEQFDQETIILAKENLNCLLEVMK